MGIFHYTRLIALSASMLMQILPGFSHQALAARAISQQTQELACTSASNGRAWSSFEISAWKSICENKEIMGANLQAFNNLTFFPALKNDTQHRISLHFLNEIFSSPGLTPFTGRMAVRMQGVLIEGGELSFVSINSFFIGNSLFEKPLKISRSSLAGTLMIEKSRSPGLALSNAIGGGSIYIEQSEIDRLEVEDSTFTKLEVFKSTTPTIALGRDRFSQEVSVSDSKIDTFDSAFVNADSYMISDITGDINLEFFETRVANELLIGGTAAQPIRFGYFHAFRFNVGLWTMNNVIFSNRTVLNDVTAERAYWSDDPVAVARDISSHNRTHLALSALFDSLKRTYAGLGLDFLARDIAIEGLNDRYRHTYILTQKIWLFLQWILAGYGYRPEWGFAWIFGFVLAGTIIFSIHPTTTSNSRPRSWFIFSLDAVLPGISLDKSMSSISFTDWRQYFLYFLRFLGAAVVVLILTWIKQSAGI